MWFEHPESATQILDDEDAEGSDTGAIGAAIDKPDS
jgi:hypothetical protein